MKVYKIRHDPTGKFWRGGGRLSSLRPSKNGKTWNTLGAVKQALRLQMNLMSRWERNPVTGRMAEVLINEEEFKSILSDFTLIELSEEGSTSRPLLELYEVMTMGAIE